MNPDAGGQAVETPSQRAKGPHGPVTPEKSGSAQATSDALFISPSASEGSDINPERYPPDQFGGPSGKKLLSTFFNSDDQVRQATDQLDKMLNSHDDADGDRDVAFIADSLGNFLRYCAWEERKARRHTADGDELNTLAVVSQILDTSTDFFRLSNVSRSQIAEHHLVRYCRSLLRKSRRLVERSRFDAFYKAPSAHVVAMRESFYRSPYHGSYPRLLVEALETYERKLDQSWRLAVLSPKWYARCIPILQSSGMGKSRLIRELGSTAPHERFVFTLCLREPGVGKDACYPKADDPVRDFLATLDECSDLRGTGEDKAKNYAYAMDLWAVKLYSFVQALCRYFADAGAEIVRNESLRAALCEPYATEAEADRVRILEDVVAQAEEIYDARRSQHALSPKMTLDGRKHASKEAFIDAVEAVLAFRHHCPTPWIVLAIDEASGICPQELVDLSVDKEPAAVAEACLANLTRIVAMPEGDDMPKPPERTWILYADTSSAISTLVPPPKFASSARAASTAYARIPPFIPLQGDLEFVDVAITRKLFSELTPLQASGESYFVRTGRPLWRSELSGAGHAANVAADDACQTVDFFTGKSVRYWATPEVVLSKLLAPENGEFLATDDQFMALLYYRLDIHACTRNTADSTQPIDHHAALLTRVHRHLGALIAWLHRGDAVKVATLDEAIVTKAVTGLFRTNGSGFQFVGILWDRAYGVMRGRIKDGFPVDRGTLGEVDAQALCCICVDRALRRPLRANSTKVADPWEGESAFVRLDDWLRQLMAKPDEELLKSLPKQAWVSYQRFSSSAAIGPNEPFFTRATLVKAFQARKALVAPKNHPVYDLCIPIYTAALDELYDPGAWSYVLIQVKNHTTKSEGAKFFTPPALWYGNFWWSPDRESMLERMSEQQQESVKEGSTADQASSRPRRTARAKGNNEGSSEQKKPPPPSERVFVPSMDPLLIWLEMSTYVNDQADTKGKAEPAKQRCVVPETKWQEWQFDVKPSPRRERARGFWSINFGEFDAKHHPALEEMGDPFPHLLPDNGPSVDDHVPDMRLVRRNALHQREVFPSPEAPPAAPA